MAQAIFSCRYAAIYLAGSCRAYARLRAFLGVKVLFITLFQQIRHVEVKTIPPSRLRRATSLYTREALLSLNPGETVSKNPADCVGGIACMYGFYQ